MTQVEYQTLRRNQDAIRRELNALKAKIAALGSLARFDELARRGRRFARARGIALADVLRGD